MSRRSWITTFLLFTTVLGTAAALAAWKRDSIQDTEAAAANQPEPIEAVEAAVAEPHEYRATATSIGTVLARRSITLRNELPGTVHQVMLAPGQIVEAGAVLVRQDVSVEEAELEALEAQAAYSETLLERNQQASETQAVSALEVDRALTERDVALAQIARTKAIIARKTIRAPFRARVGLADVHPGQYLDAGTVLTTLQGIDAQVHVDFAVAQRIAEGLSEGDDVEVFLGADEEPAVGSIVAVDSRVDSTTRNATVRARIDNTSDVPSPGASVRVRVPAGPASAAVVVPASALRTESTGDHVFVLAADEQGQTRAHLRPVDSGARLGDRVVIQGGLSAGEQVAASGSFKLRDSALVAVATDEVAVNTAASAAGAK